MTLRILTRDSKDFDRFSNITDSSFAVSRLKCSVSVLQKDKHAQMLITAHREWEFYGNIYFTKYRVESLESHNHKTVSSKPACWRLGKRVKTCILVQIIQVEWHKQYNFDCKECSSSTSVGACLWAGREFRISGFRGQGPSFVAVVDETSCSFHFLAYLKISLDYGWIWRVRYHILSAILCFMLCVLCYII